MGELIVGAADNFSLLFSWGKGLLKTKVENKWKFVGWETKYDLTKEVFVGQYVYKLDKGIDEPVYDTFLVGEKDLEPSDFCTIL